MCRRVISHDTEEWSKRWRKTDFLFEKWHYLVNFNSSSGKSENVHPDEIFLWKVCNVWAKKIQTSCVVKNDCFQKWQGIWFIFTVVESNLDKSSRNERK